jgi:hypothetical protein
MIICSGNLARFSSHAEQQPGRTLRSEECVPCLRPVPSAFQASLPILVASPNQTVPAVLATGEYGRDSVNCNRESCMLAAGYADCARVVLTHRAIILHRIMTYTRQWPDYGVHGACLLRKRDLRMCMRRGK